MPLGAAERGVEEYTFVWKEDTVGKWGKQKTKK